jgi:hypothetical protein
LGENEVRLRVTKIDEVQFLTSFKNQVWGSKTARFKDWKPGDYLVFIVEKAIAGLAEVSGEPYVSKKAVWDNGLFPNRIPLKFSHAFLQTNRLPILGEIRNAMTSIWGPKYGWGILNQSLLQDNPAETIVNAIRLCQNDLSEIQTNIHQYLDTAKPQRDILKTKKQRRSRRKSSEVNIITKEPEPPSTKEEESAHSKAQNALIQLGRVTGCSVWIASNDRSRQFKGKPLGEGCLKVLPNLGLNPEASTRISVIDVIWLRQNAPVCAFEVETTTSIYSGLLRMSDLISVVPALNIKLFIVAPKERQDKVMAELSRPTFQKIGLSEFCKFVATEDLQELLSRVEGLKGHVQPSIMDTIAFELEEEFETTLE